MPACSTARNPKGVEITFEESTHKYSSILNGMEIVYTSGTQFCGKFFKEFDPTGEITARCAKREGLTVEQIKEKWSAKGRESCRLGTRMHECCEDVFLNRPFRNKAENEIEQQRFDHAIRMSRDILQKLDVIGVEKIVFDADLGIAGTIDFLGRSKRDGSYVIIDHKSNEKIDEENEWNEFGIGPAWMIPGTNFGHYTMQLNLYKYLLYYGEYIPREAKIKMYLNHVRPSGARLIPVPSEQGVIKDAVIEYLLKYKKAPVPLKKEALNTNESGGDVLASL